MIEKKVLQILVYSKENKFLNTYREWLFKSEIVEAAIENLLLQNEVSIDTNALRPTGEKAHRINAMIPVDMYDELYRLIGKSKKSVSLIVRSAIRRFYNNGHVIRYLIQRKKREIESMVKGISSGKLWPSQARISLKNHIGKKSIALLKFDENDLPEWTGWD